MGHLAIQYAKAMGLKVIAIDTGAEKKELVEKLGADAWIDFKTTKDLVKEIRGHSDGLGPHAAIVAAASGAAYTQAVQYLREGGTLVCVGMVDQSESSRRTSRDRVIWLIKRYGDDFVLDGLQIAQNPRKLCWKQTRCDRSVGYRSGRESQGPLWVEKIEGSQRVSGHSSLYSPKLA